MIKIDALLERMIPVLDQAQVPYMVTGSVASSVHGTMRSTQDLDIVISLSPAQLTMMVSQLQALGCYADEIQAADALAHRSMFNVMDDVTGWKVDFVFSENTEYGRTALARRESVALGGRTVQLARAEDVVIAKLRWAKMGGSARQIEDVVGILKARGSDLDVAYIEGWVPKLGVEEQWALAKQQQR